MPKIVITEIDNTSPGFDATSSDVAYVPGCVDVSQASLYDETTGEYIGLEPNKPTLFTSLYQFESLCGTKPVYFETDQKYSDLSPKSFSAYAVPLNNTMFTEGSPEVGYVYAKELLKQGLPVLFERINGGYTSTEVAFPAGAAGAVAIKNSLKNDIASVQKKQTVDDFLTAPTDWGGQLIAPSTPTSAQGLSDWTIVANNSCYEYPNTYFGTKVLAGSKLFNTVKIATVEGAQKLKVSGINLGLNDTQIEFLQRIPFTDVESPSFQDFITINSTIKVINKGDTDITISDTTPLTISFEDPNYTDPRMGVTYTLGEVTIPAFSSKVITLSNAAYAEYTSSQGLLAEGIDYTINISTLTGLEVEVESIEFIDLTHAPADWDSEEFPIGVYYTILDQFVPLTETEITNFKNGTTTTIPADTYYKAVPSVVNISSIYNSLTVIYGVGQEGEGLLDKGAYSIKYLTSGGYPVFEYDNGTLADKMVALANLRGDCVAIIDHTDNIERDTNPNHSSSVYRAAVNSFKDGKGNEFATMFTPWATYSRTTVDLENNQLVEGKSNQIRMPASFAYLNSMAVSIRTNANWLAVAGVARGLVNNLADDGMTTKLSNAVADQMQPRQGVAVNAITDINPYGYTIWGNRTLKNNPVNLTATSFLNIRNLISDVKKVAYSAAKSLTYEQNNDVLWVNFQSKIQPLLNRMVSGYGISGYKIVRDTEHERYGEKATLTCKIILYPVYPVEDFYITVQLDDEEVTVE